MGCCLEKRGGNKPPGTVINANTYDENKNYEGAFPKENSGTDTTNVSLNLIILI